MIYVDPTFTGPTVPFHAGGILIGNWERDKLNGDAVWWYSPYTSIEAEEVFDLPSSDRERFYKIKFKDNRQVGKSICKFEDGSEKKTDQNFNDLANLDWGRFFNFKK